MPMMQELQVDSHPRLRERPSQLEDRVRAQRIRATRRWVIRSSLTLLLTAALACVFVAWRRDQTTKAKFLKSCQPQVTILQNRIDDLGDGRLPIRITAPDEPQGFYRPSSTLRMYAAQAEEPTIIAQMPLTDLLLAQDGRWVIIYHKGKVHPEWMSQSAYFSTMKRQLHLVEQFEQEIRSRQPVLP